VSAGLELMHLIDEQYLNTPFYGARKMAVVLSRSGHKVGRKRVMGLAVCCCCCRCEHVGNASVNDFRSVLIT
jgi:HTH-like domain